MTLDQIVLWRFHRWGAGSCICPDYYVVAWSIENQATKPIRHHGRWLIRVRGKWYSSLFVIESWTAFDPEVLDRKRLPADER